MVTLEPTAGLTVTATVPLGLTMLYTSRYVLEVETGVVPDIEKVSV
jgi:hypothetical protein